MRAKRHRLPNHPHQRTPRRRPEALPQPPRRPPRHGAELIVLCITCFAPRNWESIDSRFFVVITLRVMSRLLEIGPACRETSLRPLITRSVMATVESRIRDGIDSHFLSAVVLFGNGGGIRSDHRLAASSGGHSSGCREFERPVINVAAIDHSHTVFGGPEPQRVESAEFRS